MPLERSGGRAQLGKRLGVRRKHPAQLPLSHYTLPPNSRKHRCRHSPWRNAILPFARVDGSTLDAAPNDANCLATQRGKSYNRHRACDRNVVRCDVLAPKECHLLTEQEVSRTWSQMFKGCEFRVSNVRPCGTIVGRAATGKPAASSPDARARRAAQSAPEQTKRRRVKVASRQIKVAIAAVSPRLCRGFS